MLKEDTFPELIYPLNTSADRIYEAGRCIIYALLARFGLIENQFLNHSALSCKGYH
jgi:hypothetical protein